MTQQTSQATVTLRRPTGKDGHAVWTLIRNCPPLDVNSSYAYNLLCKRFADTCVVAERDGEVVGFISAFIPPDNEQAVFVWQVAVGENARGRGLGRSMLLDLLLRDACKRVKYLETTVTPSNEASARMFQGLARHLKTDCEESPYISGEDLGEGHEEEVLFRIGPMRPAP